MDAQVTVCARNKTARSLAKSFGLEVMDFTELKRRICQYDHIFNTVPKQILKEDILRKISKESCIIDIASYPGGTNHQMAEKLGICAKLCPSLPGIYSPKSSGIMLAKKSFRNQWRDQTMVLKNKRIGVAIDRFLLHLHKSL